MSRKMSKWEFLAWTIPLVSAFQFFLAWLDVGFLASVSVGIVTLIPVHWLGKKVIRPEDL